MRKMVYLCSRVSYDARELNSKVAKQLTEAGFDVYVPHEQAPNQLTQQEIDEARFDVKTIFRLDFHAMRTSDLCVVVGRVGKDCSFEIGWFYSRGLPIYHVPAGDETYKTSPMLLPALATKVNVETAGADIQELEFLASIQKEARREF